MSIRWTVLTLINAHTHTHSEREKYKHMHTRRAPTFLAMNSKKLCPVSPLTCNQTYTQSHIHSNTLQQTISSTSLPRSCLFVLALGASIRNHSMTRVCVVLLVYAHLRMEACRHCDDAHLRRVTSHHIWPQHISERLRARKWVPLDYHNLHPPPCTCQHPPLPYPSPSALFDPDILALSLSNFFFCFFFSLSLLHVCAHTSDLTL